MKNLLLIIILAVSCQASSAGTINPKVDDSKYLEYGQKHKCVLRIRTVEKRKDKKPITAMGSCVVIKPRIIVTAAHVVNKIDELYVVKDNDEQVKIMYSAFPSIFAGEKFAEFADIAVCYLSEEIKLDFYPELYRDRDEAGKICSIAGYGVSGTWDKGVSIFKSQKRAGSNFIDGIDNEMLQCTVGKGKSTTLEYMIASGDSGGGLFIDKKLAGINSNVSTLHADKNPNSDKKDWANHTRVSNHVAWIDKIIEVFETVEKEKHLE